jgi:hypothetical protein
MDFQYSNGTTKVVPFPILIEACPARDNRKPERAHPSGERGILG